MHTPGVENGRADAISQNNMCCFRSRDCRVPIPPALIALLTETARLDVSGLGLVVWELFSAGLAPSTRQNYLTGTKRCIEFCRDQQIVNPFPASEQTLSHFVAWLHTQHWSSSTVKNYLAAVKLRWVWETHIYGFNGPTGVGD